ncbi:uncharacterized protein AMSG_11615 [Thecamonas trahens ATCC 50062]|uniref:Uncharacterized protein n=1 Tax=Thecamonas trahens ATCC 50062 TaxID=461836 RepID=A0A0L0DE46_THETB|nr:hypothetical protein AMSG_11615 [Thecamonas trahens ATCC 50062]KNC50587.1 hypothetical protein AMSG_11615 [Thecamonas trahens ATCC 50062]|eukprot:XP_013762594.1 hypothetical protein AMSG_11615 [Thecamonas trahens ATCC 50062]
MHAAVAGSCLDISAVSLSQPKNDSVVVAYTARLSHAGSFPATLHGLRLAIAFRGSHLGDLDVGDVHVSGGAAVVERTDTLVPDPVVFSAFGQALVNDSAVVWQVAGTPRVCVLAGLYCRSISLTKDITLPAFGGLADVSMLVFDMDHSTPHAVVLNLVINIYNPSVVTIDPLGDLFFGIYYQDVLMGHVVVRNVVLVAHSYNHVALSGVFNPQDTVLGAEVISAYLRGDNVTVSSRAASTGIVCSQHLYNDALHGLSIDTLLIGNKTALIAGSASTPLP